MNRLQQAPGTIRSPSPIGWFFLTRRPLPTHTAAPSPWLWALAGVVVLAALAGVGYLIYTREDRKRAALVAAVCLVWAIGLGTAFSQLFPGVAQRLPLPFLIEGQPDAREVPLDRAKQIASFPIYVPSYLPSEFALESVHVQRAGKSSGTVVLLTYYDRRSNSEIQVWESEAAGPAVSPGESNLQVMGEYAKVTPSTEGTVIEWSYGTTRLELSGDFGKVELIKIARSMH